MGDLAVARVLHVLCVVLWIGGVAMVTLVLVPGVTGEPNGFKRFESIERRFATQSKITVLLAGLSGFYIVWRLDLWARFAELRFWWMHAMVAVWVIFAAVLFVLEPLLLHDWFRSRASRNPYKTMLLIQRLHWVLLALSLITVAGAVAGSHGGF
ncbi:MAG TPA: hypothetical protein VHE58_10905 [Burkholderiales bacterium]|nr:hypothetical protein [Burkholderiales bacterium]